jgi:site-specific recombinase XerD
MNEQQIKLIVKQVDEYLEYCELTRQMSKMTLRSKRHTYHHFIEDCGVDDLEKLDNKAFNQWANKQSSMGVSARTINTRVAHLKAMLSYHRDMGLVMPIKLLQIKKLREGPARRIFFTREEIEYVLRFADSLTWLLIRIVFDAGLRISELRNLRMCDFFGRMIKFVGKGFKSRESYVAQDTHERLQKWIEENNITDAIWINEYGNQYGVDQLRNKMHEPFRKAADALRTRIQKEGDPTGELHQFLNKLDNFYPHSLRHSFGTDIQRKGATLLEMQQMLGHSNAETTQRYIHGLDGQLENLFTKYKNEVAEKPVEVSVEAEITKIDNEDENTMLKLVAMIKEELLANMKK